MKATNLLVALLATLTLAAGCAADDTGTDEKPKACGNGVCEAGETAADCPADCSVCQGGQCGTCGNGQLEAGEACDGPNLGGQTCATAGFFGGALSCADDCTLDTTSCCNNDCASQSETRCNGQTAESCNLDAGGCLTWSTIADCAALGQNCTTTPGAATCTGSCTDACPKSGDTQCNSDVVETCSQGSSGCLEWTQTKDCAAENKSCDATGGTAKCGACADQCTWGQKQCSGNVIQTCLQGTGGCTEWSTTEDCAAIGQLCQPNAGSPICGGGCTKLVPRREFPGMPERRCQHL